MKFSKRNIRRHLGDLLNKDGSLKETPEEREASEREFAALLKKIADTTEIASEDPNYMDPEDEDED